MKSLFFLSFLIFSLNVYSQPILQWQNTIGGSGNETFNKMTKTYDGGFLVAGRTSSTISGDKTVAGSLWILKLGETGNIVWQKGFSGIASYAPSIVRDVKQTKDSGFVVIADINVPSNGLNYGILKLDSLGNLQWQKNYGGNIDDIPGEIIETLDGGYLIAGASNSHISGDKSEFNIGYPNSTARDYWVLKLDSQGNLQWENTIGGTLVDEAFSAVQFSDSTYLLIGGSSSEIFADKTVASKGSYDYWLVKLRTDGSIIWDKSIGGSGSDFPWSSALLNNNEVVIAGASESGISGDKTDINYGLTDFWIVKIDSSGNIIWQNTMGGGGSDVAFDVSGNADQSIMVCGRTNSNQSATKAENLMGGTDCWVMKLSASGNTLWENSIGGTGLDDARSVVQANDGGYVMSAISNSPISFDKAEASMGLQDFWVVKIESDGVINPYTSLELKMFLQGYMGQSGNMVPVLQNQGVVMNSLLVDTIEVQLVHPITLLPTVNVKTLLQTDGTLMGNIPLSELGTNRYIVIKHRNHIETWSANPVLIAANATYDFSLAANKAYASNQFEVELGLWGFYSGDINQDGVIDGLDYNDWENDSNNFAGGYFNTDLNGDGIVDGLDFIYWEQNSNNFVGVVIP
jgi:hypothetical protein